MPEIPERTEPGKNGSTNISGRTVLMPEGSITHEECHKIEKEIDDAIQQNKVDIILDCKHVSFLDSAALESLVKIHNKLKDRGGILKIVRLNDICRDILIVTQIINALFVYKDIHEAMRNTA
jgi:anti-anti-sigma factor